MMARGIRVPLNSSNGPLLYVSNIPHSYRASYIATEKIAHAPILSKLTLRIGAPLSRITNFTLGNSELEYKVYHYSIM